SRLVIAPQKFFAGGDFLSRAALCLVVSRLTIAPVVTSTCFEAYDSPDSTTALTITTRPIRGRATSFTREGRGSPNIAFVRPAHASASAVLQNHDALRSA